MSALRPVEIAGGGLAGLSLALALRRAGVPVTLHEAGTYPRHRVCGEFVAGLDSETIEQLQLAPFFEGARTHRSVAWFGREGMLFRHRLPRPAAGLSRRTLDTRLARAFVADGGALRENSRLEPLPAPPGRVFATGRRREGGDWLGLKLHARGLTLDADLELHLGDQAYVGLAGVEDGRVNVCGLFRRRPVRGSATDIFGAYLRAAGLERLADRLARAEPCPESHAAIAGLSFSRPAADPGRLTIGDAFGAIPPFTGDGMAMAFQSAATALPPLLAWSRDELAWSDAVSLVQRRLRRRFALRLAIARLLHPWLLAPNAQCLLAKLPAERCLPLRVLYHALH